VIYVPSRDVYTTLIGTFDQENIKFFIDKIMAGKQTMTKVDKSKIKLVDRKCEELKETTESFEDDEILKELIEEEKKKREEFDRARKEEPAKKKGKKKKKKSDL
jgi:hypothetical protein